MTQYSFPRLLAAALLVCCSASAALLAGDDAKNPQAPKGGSPKETQLPPGRIAPSAEGKAENENSFVVDLGAGVNVKMVRVPKGRAYLGFGNGGAGTRQEDVPEFYLGIYEVTQSQWKAVMGADNNPSHFKGDNLPLESVPWSDVKEFIKRINRKKSGKRIVFRLPTDVEWEYACRGGPISEEESRFNFYFDKPTNDLSAADANFNSEKPAGKGSKGAQLNQTVKVGSYKPNRLGLYDMHGNVSEFTDTLDGFGEICRGGSWENESSLCGVAGQTRSGMGPSPGKGFRLAASLLASDFDSTFAAIAFSLSTGKYGFGSNCRTKETAEQAALANCSAADAKVVGSVKGGWLALAVGVNNAYGLAWTFGTEGKIEAKERALAECHKRSSEAKLKLCICSAYVAPEAAAFVEAPPRRLIKLDDELRAKFGKSTPLPETKRKLPAATAERFNWVTVTGNTPIHYQGGVPSCVAQACVAALEWNWQIRNGAKTKPVLSPQPIIDRLNKSDFLNYGDVMNQLLLNGTADFSTYPYTGVPHDVPAKAKTPYRVIAWGKVGESGQPTVADIKQALLEHGPLVTGIYSTDAFKAYRGGIFAENFANIPTSQPTNHAVVIVGWDDKRGRGAWMIQNSWGPKWGEGGGGAWIEYGCNNIGRFAYWLRAQSTQYVLGPDVHKLLGPSAAPFARWPSAKDLTELK